MSGGGGIGGGVKAEARIQAVRQVREIVAARGEEGGAEVRAGGRRMIRARSHRGQDGIEIGAGDRVGNVRRRRVRRGGVAARVVRHPAGKAMIAGPDQMIASDFGMKPAGGAPSSGDGAGAACRSVCGLGK